MCTLLLSVFCNLYLKLANHHHHHKTTPSYIRHHIQLTILHTKLYYPLKSLFSIHTLLYIFSFQYIFAFCRQFSRISCVFFVKKSSYITFRSFNQFVERFELSQFYYCLVVLNTEIKLPIL